MTIETATYINDLQPLNPGSADPTNQGDDHLRLVKLVLQNQFTGASRAFQIPSTRVVSTNYSIVKADGEGSLYVSTAGGAVNLTLPGLAAADQGWRIFITKTTLDVNPVYILPVSGSVNSGGYSVTKARRCVPGRRIAAVWDGAAWFIERANALPIGTMLGFFGTNLPAGFDWPNGQVLTSGNYPEYYAVYGAGNTPDMRGLSELTLDNLGGTSAGRLPNGFIAQTTLGAVGGADGVALTTANLASHFHAAGISDPTHSHSASVSGGVYGSTALIFNYASGGVQGGAGSAITVSIGGAATGVRVNSSNGLDTTYSTGSGTVHSSLQPSMMVAKILVVE